jgi:hypothetical protein
MRRLLVLSGLSTLSILAACGSPNDAASGDDGGAPGTSDDGGLADADAIAPDGAHPPVPGCHDFTDPQFWSFFDMTALLPVPDDGGVPPWAATQGAVFDGRYVYTIPECAGADGFTGQPPTLGAAIRYDTRASFASTSSYELVLGGLQDFAGGAFDGRYVYYVPGGNCQSSTTSALITRFDTQGSFTSPGSWTTFDLTTVASDIVGLVGAEFAGAVFDGKYLYLVPYAGGYQTNSPPGTMLRFDTTGSFTDKAAWTAFDARPLGGYGAFIARGGTFDGRYIYMLRSFGERAVRYDTQAPFGDMSSWSSFDLGSLGSTSSYANGFAVDHYIYFAPYEGTAVLRFDTQRAFNDASSWATFDVSALDLPNKGDATIYDIHSGIATDGCYVYLVPGRHSELHEYDEFVNTPGPLIRYDPGRDFTAASSWSAVDIRTLNANAKRFFGATFDGRYLYLTPDSYGASSMLARFDTKYPPALPSGFRGSFF